MIREEWRPIPGWEGLYSISSRGRVRSEERWVEKRDGKKQPVRECVLTPQEWARVFLSRDGKKHSMYPRRVVAQVFGSVPA